MYSAKRMRRRLEGGSLVIRDDPYEVNKGVRSQQGSEMSAPKYTM